MSFQLQDHEASIANLNSRIQRHGEDRQLAADIKFRTSASSSVLDAFDSHMRVDLFRSPGQGEQQELPGTGGNGLTAVKHPGWEPVKLSHEFAGYEMQIGGHLEASEPIVLADVKLKRFVVEPKEGGSVDLTFTASAEIEPDDLAELSDAFIREDVLLTLIPPKRSAPAEDLTEDGDTLDQQESADGAAEAKRLADLANAA